VLEDEGRIHLPPTVEAGLERVRDLSRLVMVAA
jgi:hypothetical protein